MAWVVPVGCFEQRARCWCRPCCWRVGSSPGPGRLTSDGRSTSGNVVIDDALFAEPGVTDPDRHRVVPGTTDIIPDCYVDRVHRVPARDASPV